MNIISNCRASGVLSGVSIFILLMATVLTSSTAAIADQASDKIDQTTLLKLISAKVTDVSLAMRMKDKCVAFEDRLPDHAEICATYAAVAKLLLNDQSIVDAHEKSNLAFEILSQAADPHSINQGHHNTCALAAVETCIYDEHPSVAAAIVEQVASTGAFVDVNGHRSTIELRNIHADAEAIRSASDDRSHASQLFQLCTANVLWQNKRMDPRGLRCNRGSIHYVQNKPHHLGDTGERLLIQWGNGITETVMDDNGLPMAQPACSLDAVQQIGNLIMPGNRQLCVIGRTTVDKAQKHLSVKSVDDLRTALLHGPTTPLIAAVNLSRGYFLRDHSAYVHANDRALETATLSVRSNAGVLSCELVKWDWKAASATHTLKGQQSNNNTMSSQTWHAVCITGYNPDTDTVSIDNFWGPQSDHLGRNGVGLADLFQSM